MLCRNKLLTPYNIYYQHNLLKGMTFRIYYVIILAAAFCVDGDAGSVKTHDCDLDALAKLNAGDECKAEWGDIKAVLRPTQNSVGYAWVQRIVEYDMQSKDDAQDEMDGKIVPVVVAQFASKLYILDHHHHLSALDTSLTKRSR